MTKHLKDNCDKFSTINSSVAVCVVQEIHIGAKSRQLSQLMPYLAISSIAVGFGDGSEGFRPDWVWSSIQNLIQANKMSLIGTNSTSTRNVVVANFAKFDGIALHCRSQRIITMANYKSLSPHWCCVKSKAYSDLVIIRPIAYVQFDIQRWSIAMLLTDMAGWNFYRSADILIFHKGRSAIQKQLI